MISVAIVVVIFSFMLVVMKLFSRYGVDNLQAIVVNYLTAGAMGLIFMDGTFSLSGLLSKDWLIYAVGVGVLFILTFSLLALATQTVGLAVATVANKMSLVVPVFAAIWLYNEPVTIAKIVGIVLALVSIYLTSTNKGKFSFDLKYLWIVLIIFIGQGIADTFFNHARATHVANSDRMLFFAMIFLIAGLIGLLFSLIKLGKGSSHFKLKNVLWGILLGIPNYYTLEFFFKALNSGDLDSSQVYPLINMGIVVLTSILGILIFRERLTAFNWTGILLAIGAIALLAFGI